MKRALNRNFRAAAVLAVLALACGSACGQASERFKASGKAAALTVLPVGLAGTPNAQVGEVIAMMLERGGMANLETSRTAFTPPAEGDMAESAKAFAEFVRANPPATEYALFADFLGTPQTGVAEVRAIIANKQGEIVWQDRQAKGDADFDRIRPREPLQACTLVAERLRPVLGLGDPGNESAPAGKIARRWQESTGIPAKAEQEAIEQRGGAFKRASAGSSMLVYPVHAGSAYSAESAAAIAAALNEEKLVKATAAGQGPHPESARNMNEQKVLWSMARAFSAEVKKNPPAADFALFAEYLMGKDGVGAVHLAICNRQGELVVVDFQNDHQPDFKAIAPKSREDCDRLVLKRLQGYCK